jgi:hypothetical protein
MGSEVFGAVTSTGFTPNIPGSVFLPNIAGPGASGTFDGYWIASGSALHNGIGNIKYQILTVIYAPPGTNGGNSKNSVTYSAGANTTTTTSASQSFKNSINVSVTQKNGILGAGISGSGSFGYSNTSTDTQSLQVTQSSTATIGPVTGSTKDGINHDYDVIYLFLQPQVDLALTSSAASWTFGDNSHKHIQYVLVGQLNHHLTWDDSPGVKAELDAAHINEADYGVILTSDPLVAGSPPDPNRFVDENTMLPYEAPPTGGAVVPITQSISSSSTATTGTTVQNTYTVGMSISATVGGDPPDAGLASAASTTLNDVNNWEWSNTSSRSSSSGSIQTASVTIGGPAPGYPGPTELAVYRDTVYNTFAFVLVPPERLQVAATGTLKTDAGAPVVGAEVTLSTVAGVHRTFTNSKGEFAFFGDFPGPITVQAAGATPQVVPQSGSPRSVQLQKRG